MTEQPVKSERFTFMATPEMVEIINRLAEKYHTTRSQVVRILIREQATRLGLEVPEEVLYEST